MRLILVVFLVLIVACCFHQGSSNKDCQLKKDKGDCDTGGTEPARASLRWYYDSNSTSCRRFVFGGCKGNGNNFNTRSECIKKCARKN